MFGYPYDDLVLRLNQMSQQEKLEEAAQQRLLKALESDSAKPNRLLQHLGQGLVALGESLQARAQKHPRKITPHFHLN